MNYFIPKKLEEIAGNGDGIRQTLQAVAGNGGRWNGLALMMRGKSGQGKTTLAECIGKTLEHQGWWVSKQPIDCTDEGQVENGIKAIRQGLTLSLCGECQLIVFDECDRLTTGQMAELKIPLDLLRKSSSPTAAVIFTTAKTNEQIVGEKGKHWHEFASRCAQIPVGIRYDEFNEFFSIVTGGQVKQMSVYVPSMSMRSAWDWIRTKEIETVPEQEYPKHDLSELWAEIDSAGAAAKTKEVKPARDWSRKPVKRQQDMIGILCSLMNESGGEMRPSDMGRILEDEKRYDFKRGVTGFLVTRLVTSSIFNHIKKYGDACKICRTVY